MAKSLRPLFSLNEVHYYMNVHYYMKTCAPRSERRLLELNKGQSEKSQILILNTLDELPSTFAPLYSGLLAYAFQWWWKQYWYVAPRNQSRTEATYVG